MTDRPARPRARKRRPARLARILVTGLSAAGMLGMIGGLGLREGASAGAAATGPIDRPEPEARPTIVVRIVRRHAPAQQVVRRVVRRQATPAVPTAPSHRPPDTVTRAS